MRNNGFIKALVYIIRWEQLMLTPDGTSDMRKLTSRKTGFARVASKASRNFFILTADSVLTDLPQRREAEKPSVRLYPLLMGFFYFSGGVKIRTASLICTEHPNLGYIQRRLDHGKDVYQPHSSPLDSCRHYYCGFRPIA